MSGNHEKIRTFLFPEKIYRLKGITTAPTIVALLASFPSKNLAKLVPLHNCLCIQNKYKLQSESNFQEFILDFPPQQLVVD